jgi:hypothetical protein
MSAYLLINTQTGLVENNVEWDGDVNTWQPPANCTTMLVGTQYPKVVWNWNTELDDWVQEETVGVGNIGETWTGTMFIQPKPTWKPEPPLPVQE